MDSVLTAAIWAGAVVLVSVMLLLRFGKSLNGLMEARRASIEAANQLELAETLERQNEAELNRVTANERAELRKAELRRQAAEADAAAEIARNTIPAQIAAEEQVIAARAEGRALAAKERALNGGGDIEALRVLMEGYETYRQTGGMERFDVWLGDLRVVDGDLVGVYDD